MERIRNARSAIQSTIAYIQSQPEIFPPRRLEKKRLTSRDQRLVIRTTWRAFLDRLIALDEVGHRYDRAYRKSDGAQKRRMFRIGYATFLAEYRYAMDFIALMENDPSMHTLLNEAVPELGLGKDRYKKLKFRFLNLMRGANFARLNLLYRHYGKDTTLDLTAGMGEDIKAIWQAGKGRGPKQTLKNASKIIEDTGLTLIFPAQKGVSEWMGDVKVRRLNHSLITPEQTRAMQALLKPGDILLERREWYLSNIGLPGYWPHAALYIGTPEERTAYFSDPAIRDRYKKQHGDFNAYLQENYPVAYKTSVTEQEQNHKPRVIEAISEGVSFTTLEHSVDADSVVILRPRISKLEKAIAIERAYQFSGRPYDFNFDFLTDATLVCTELVYKAYEPERGYSGVRFPLQEIVGRQVTTANDIARMFDEQYGTDRQQLEFIAFFDGHERKGKAVSSNVESFRKSWKRAKWYIWIQDTALEKSAGR